MKEYKITPCDIYRGWVIGVAVTSYCDGRYYPYIKMDNALCNGQVIEGIFTSQENALAFAKSYLNLAIDAFAEEFRRNMKKKVNNPIASSTYLFVP